MPKNDAPWWVFIPVLRWVFDDARDKYYTADNLPERLKGKVALLSICEESSYVEGIGYRHSYGNIFYVTD
tara:strand:- start:564 stop:773 length:210 start_codon:yes stop_codon:yes gene_type:complete